jgi:hypothetical protein
MQQKSIVWTGDLAQMVEYLLYKHEALSSKPSPAKKQKKKKKPRK